MAVAALVLGILAVLADIIPFGAFIGLPFGLVAMILGIIARKKAKAESAPTGMATAGMALGITGLALGALLASACAYCVKVGGDLNKEMEQQQQQRRADPAYKKQMDDFNNALKEGDKKPGAAVEPEKKAPAALPADPKAQDEK